jgi:hypothetical protein
MAGAARIVAAVKTNMILFVCYIGIGSSVGYFTQ